MGIPVGKAANQPTIRPTEYRCYIKEDDHQYGAAGAKIPSWAEALRPPVNSPFRRHFTRDPLLCSALSYTIGEEM